VSESFRQAAGRKVVSRATAQQLGTVSHLLVTADGRRVAAVVMGKGKKASLVDWSQLTGFGTDAVMVGDEAALRQPADAREHAAAEGKLELIGRRLLSESGNELGTVDDVTFDPASGALEALHGGAHQVAADAVLGAGSYAVVVAASAGAV
jgi:uncharacterized protein YrrD